MPATEFGLNIFPMILAETEDNNIFRAVAQTMLTDLAELKATFRLAADRVFFGSGEDGKGQTITNNYVFIDASNAIDFDDVTGYNQFLAIKQYIGFTGPRIFTGEFGNIMFAPGPGLSPDVVRIGVPVVVSNTFDFNDHNDGSALKRAFAAINTFSFTQSLVGFERIDVFQYLDLEDLIDSSATVFVRDDAQKAVKQSVAFKITGGPTACPEKEYSPFIGSSDDTTYGDVNPVPPTLGSGTLTLTYPQAAPTVTLVLKNPDMNNSDAISYRKLDRETQGGQRVIFSDPKWVSGATVNGGIEVLELVITNLDECQVTIDGILDFLNSSLGKEIGLLDWEGRNWRGFIREPDTDVIPRLNGFEVRLSFEGRLA